MTYGKQICKTLKEIRQTIAEKNNIQYAPTECHFDGECQGTCPKCEAELRYLENEIGKRKHVGKVATIAGISFGIASAFSACHTETEGDPFPPPTIIEGDIATECIHDGHNDSDTNAVFTGMMRVETKLQE